MLVGHKLPTSFEARAQTIRKKHLKPRLDVVSALSQVLRALVSKDLAAFIHAVALLMRAK
jgi:hypothetical protein